jgi:transcriptional regulator with XRE-family HTH domain
MITGDQVREARVLVNWSQTTLAKAAGCDVAFVNDFENERHAPLPEAYGAIRRVLEEAGAEFPAGGVPPRFKSGAETPATWLDPRSHATNKIVSLKELRKRRL